MAPSTPKTYWKNTLCPAPATLGLSSIVTCHSCNVQRRRLKIANKVFFILSHRFSRIIIFLNTPSFGPSMGEKKIT